MSLLSKIFHTIAEHFDELELDEDDSTESMDLEIQKLNLEINELHLEIMELTKKNSELKLKCATIAYETARKISGDQQDENCLKLQRLIHDGDC